MQTIMYALQALHLIPKRNEIQIMSIQTYEIDNFFPVPIQSPSPLINNHNRRKKNLAIFSPSPHPLPQLLIQKIQTKSTRYTKISPYPHSSEKE